MPVQAGAEAVDKGHRADVQGSPVHLARTGAVVLQALRNNAQENAQHQPPFVHVLTHKNLHSHAVTLALTLRQSPKTAGQWITATQWPTLGLPAPVRQLLVNRSNA